MKIHRIAVIAGDGIGKEVMPEGVRAVEAAARKFGISLQFTAIETVLVEGPRTPDMGGNGNTIDVGKAIAEAI